MDDQLPLTSRILHCPENLGNNAKCLSDREKRLGYHSQSISLRKEAFGFQADKTLVKSGSFILGELARWKLLALALFEFDVIHFNNGKTIMPHRVPFASVRKRTNILIALLYVPYAWLLEGKDLLLLRAFGKKLYFTFQGSDARLSTHYTELHSNEILGGLDADYLSSTADSYKQKRIALAEKYAVGIFCLNPDLLVNFSEKAQYVPYYNVDLKSTKTHEIFTGERIHIVHAPSKQNIKGTKYILEAIESLSKTHANIKFTLVENLSNKEAQKIYDTADLFIDQLIVGWYGGAAIELLARGVPVLCYIAPDNQPWFGNCPIVNCSIETLLTDISNFLGLQQDAINEIAALSIEFASEQQR